MKLLRKIKRLYYTEKIKKQCARYGKGLAVNGSSIVTKNTVLGNCVNFNGMKIYGKGRVKIVNYFHSGVECIMITSNHCYEGEKIPYDERDIKKIFL